MGDRCYMEINGRALDAPAFEAVGFSTVANGGTAQFTEDERNYADTDELPKKVPFYGWHGEGCGYGSGVFACDGDRFIYCASNRSDKPCVEVQPDGTVEPSDMTEVRQYFEVKAAAIKAIKAAPVPPPPPPEPEALPTPLSLTVIALNAAGAVCDALGDPAVNAAVPAPLRELIDKLEDALHNASEPE